VTVRQIVGLPETELSLGPVCFASEAWRGSGRRTGDLHEHRRWRPGAEPSAGLSLIIAATSSLREKVIPTDTIVIGEVGLSGEVRPVQNGQDRLLEAAKLGFKRAIVPPGNVHKGGIPDLEIIPVVNVSQAIEWVAAL